jgi:hypothetical protein
VRENAFTPPVESQKIEKARSRGPIHFLFGKVGLSVNLSLARLADPAQIIDAAQAACRIKRDLVRDIQGGDMGSSFASGVPNQRVSGLPYGNQNPQEPTGLAGGRQTMPGGLLLPVCPVILSP